MLSPSHTTKRTWHVFSPSLGELLSLSHKKILLINVVFKIYIAVLLYRWKLGKNISFSLSQTNAFFKEQNLLVKRTIYQSGKGGPASSQDTLEKEELIPLTAHATQISVKPDRAQLLTILVALLRPENVLEIGTGYGVSAAYITQALKASAKLVTIEVKKSHMDIAQALHDFLGDSKKIKFVHGAGVRYVTKENIQSPQLVFMDGGHTKENNLELFILLLRKTSVATVFIFDDIHWSLQMQEFWAYIQHHRCIAWSRDFGYFGIAVRNDEYQDDLWFEEILKYASPQTKSDLAKNYKEGQNGFEINYERAFVLAKAAYDGGWRFAPIILASLYAGGLGVTQDVRQAILLLEECIRETNTHRAYYNLGRIYEEGRGITQDLHRARHLYSEAAARGNENASKRLEYMDELKFSYG